MVLDAEILAMDATKVLVRLSGRLILGLRLREVESRITQAIDERSQIKKTHP